MPKILEREVVIIGGGLAGSAAAALLAVDSKDVLLLEKTSGAHHKVCGEFISWEAAHYLAKLGIDLPALGAQPVENLTLRIGKHSIHTKLPFQAHSLSRRRLDEALLACARDKGAEIRRGEIINLLKRDDDDWLITVGNEIVRSRTVFFASGKHDIRGWNRPRTRQSGLIGFKMHMKLTDENTNALRNHIEMFLFKGGYAGLELIEDSIANLCLLITERRYKALGKNWLDLLASLKIESIALRDRLESAAFSWEKPISVSGMPYGYIYRDDYSMPGLYRLGDQMAVIPSFAGDGMAMALHSAFLASSFYLKGGVSKDYHAQARKDFTHPVKTAGIVGVISRLSPCAIRALQTLWPGSVAWISKRVRLNRRLFLPCA